MNLVNCPLLKLTFIFPYSRLSVHTLCKHSVEIKGKTQPIKQTNQSNVIYPLLSVANLPNGFIEYSNTLQSEGLIRTKFRQKRGVYIWTNKINKHQYVGSSNNLSTRLSNYFSLSYLKFQCTRGSIISAAIFKHGLSQFSLQILALGKSLNHDSLSNNSDFLLLEQYYLDRYMLQYNVRRIVFSSPPAPQAPQAESSYLKKTSCPTLQAGQPQEGERIINLQSGLQSGKRGPEAAAWSYKHSPEQKALWSFNRSTPIFIYDATTLVFIGLVYGYERLAKLLGVHINTASRICKSSCVYGKYIISLTELNYTKLEQLKSNNKTKSTKIKLVYVYNKNQTVLLKTFPSVNSFMKFSKLSGYTTKLICTSNTIWLNKYILSYDLIPGADNSLTNVGEFKPNLKKGKTNIPVYLYSADEKVFLKRFSSLRECVKTLEGNRNFNLKPLQLRIEHKELYKGYRVSNIPLFKHPIEE